MFWPTMVSKEYTGCVRSQTINAPEFWEAAKKAVPSIGGRSLKIKKNFEQGGGVGGRNLEISKGKEGLVMYP